MDHVQVAIVYESLSTSFRSTHAVSTQSHPSDVTHNYIWPAREPSGFQEDHYPQSRPSSYFQSTHPVKTQRSWRITDRKLINLKTHRICFFANPLKGLKTFKSIDCILLRALFTCKYISWLPYNKVFVWPGPILLTSARLPASLRETTQEVNLPF